MARGSGEGGEGTGASGARSDRRYIYNGTPGGGTIPSGIRPNKKGVRRKASTFNIILLLFGLGGAIVFYINNIIAINRLSADIDELRARHDRMLKSNTSLRSEISKKSSWDRIGGLAAANGLRPAQRQPEWITLDRNRIRELEAVARPGRRRTP
jgi:hypothetical protein